MYDELKEEAEKEKILIVTMPLTGDIKGLYADQVIALNSQLDTTAEKACILAEELGHYYTTDGNILDQDNITNRKQEVRARRWAVARLVSIEDLIDAFNEGVRDHHELAEFLGVTEPFLDTMIDHFKRIYGCTYSFHEYVISFDPLGVYKRFK